jgi:hypothetical protein
MKEGSGVIIRGGNNLVEAAQAIEFQFEFPQSDLRKVVRDVAELVRNPPQRRRRKIADRG